MLTPPPAWRSLLLAILLAWAPAISQAQSDEELARAELKALQAEIDLFEAPRIERLCASVRRLPRRARDPLARRLALLRAGSASPPPDTGSPQAVQNFAFCKAGAPHAVHVRDRAFPQLWQYFDPAGLAEPQFGQLTSGLTKMVAFVSLDRSGQN